MAKVKYGLKNVHVAIATIDESDHSATYGEPIAIPGAVNMDLSAEGELTPFRADNIDYWVGNSNNGYQGDLEMALFPDEFRKAVLGYTEDENGVLIENKDTEAIHFALMFEFDNDVKATRRVLYNCTATRPSEASETTGETIEPTTETATIKASSIYNKDLKREVVKGQTGANTDATTYDDWYKSVYQSAGEASE